MLSRLAALQDAPDLEAAMDEDLKVFVYEGRGLRDDLAEVTHGNRDPEDVDGDALRVWLKRAWRTEAHMKAIRVSKSYNASYVGDPPTGLDPYRVARGMRKRLDEGKRPLWERDS